ncbi:hypothetical protein [Roseateles sp.]|uniref:hypothetical protein n=1 Tax=Roseateles sp. TaxID=1971397 RepID=UPI0031D81C93
MLIVDSLWDSAVGLERLADSFGWDVRTANSAGEAQRAAATFHPQLVMISMASVEELWLALAQRLRGDLGGDVQLVALSTAWPASLGNLKPYPFDEVLQKPLHLSDVQALSDRMRRRMPELVFNP